MTHARAQALETRRQALRAKIARLRRSTAGRRPERRRRLPLVLLLLLLLLLVCLRVPPVPEPAPPAPPPTPAAVGPAPAPEPTGRVARKPRPRFQNAAPEPLPWLAAFHLQVAARSPRLAACFTGAARPGALKWSAGVEPRHGRISDQALEPTLASDDLTGAQRACVSAVLSAPPYELDVADSPSTPSRVSLVIEF